MLNVLKIEPVEVVAIVENSIGEVVDVRPIINFYQNGNQDIFNRESPETPS